MILARALAISGSNNPAICDPEATQRVPCQPSSCRWICCRSRSDLVRDTLPSVILRVGQTIADSTRVVNGESAANIWSDGLGNELRCKSGRAGGSAGLGGLVEILGSASDARARVRRAVQKELLHYFDALQAA